MGALSVAELYKTYAKGPLKGKPRLVKFAEKYKNGEEFEMMNGTKVKMFYVPDTYKLLVSAIKSPQTNRKEMNNLTFMADKGRATYSLKHFLKSVEFDGKPGAAAGIEAENKTVDRINLMLKNAMKKYSYTDGVPIIAKGKVVGKAVSCWKVPGTPKSDIALLDKNGQEVVWISYKKGTSAKDFQQWAGVTSATMQSFPQVQEFLQKVKKKFPKGMVSGDNVAMHIKGRNSTLLKKKAVYGDDYEPNTAYGRNNVTFVVQGRLDIKSVSNGYTVTSSSAHVYENGDNFRASEDPVFFARYTGDRSGGSKRKAKEGGSPIIENARIGIFPFSGINPKGWLD